ncbi:ABC transporter ATP-binding protein [Olleya sp. HaHaR_3_96]|uniref:ABC transporter ATP-binding protein n=1 Tax=Olleya sp. HaHaR_3_96 TaxID=2745560 RepID=UPI001C4F44F1|nr:ATP-binding cassette domain-containing protein [Olleya sp. HaHaR_3_96]QXP58737.1 ATP-binding cassette domain-containing protein [Olleya sp. HaHaR_3_96]
MVQTNDLIFQYKKNETIFSFPNITLEQQENVLVLGKSGIGKTTFLHLLAGLLKPINGRVVVDNVDVSTLSNSKLDAFRGQNIGIVFQKKYAIPTLNVIENLKARLFFSKTPINNKAVDTLLKELGIYQFKKSKTNELSEGQLQRLSIALAVVHKPKLILADEPTSSLDDDNCKIVIELLLKQAKQTNANLIVITHDFRVKSYFQNSITL